MAFKWIVRILATVVFLVGLVFYYVYSTPPEFVELFIYSGYSIWDVLWYFVFPIMLLGLAIGWVFPRIGGYLIIMSVSMGLVIGLVNKGDYLSFLLIPFIIGILYLIDGYRGRKHKENE